SGLMGHSVAAAAEFRGAQVTLVTASAMKIPEGVEAVHVESAAEMQEAVTGLLDTTDILVMAAAVADFRPRDVSPVKVRKGDMGRDRALKHTADILGSLPAPGAGRRLVRVGFA